MDTNPAQPRPDRPGDRWRWLLRVGVAAPVVTAALGVPGADTAMADSAAPTFPAPAVVAAPSSTGDLALLRVGSLILVIFLVGTALTLLRGRLPGDRSARRGEPTQARTIREADRIGPTLSPDLTVLGPGVPDAGVTPRRREPAGLPGELPPVPIVPDVTDVSAGLVEVDLLSLSGQDRLHVRLTGSRNDTSSPMCGRPARGFPRTPTSLILGTDENGYFAVDVACAPDVVTVRGPRPAVERQLSYLIAQFERDGVCLAAIGQTAGLPPHTTRLPALTEQALATLPRDVPRVVVCLDDAIADVRMLTDFATSREAQNSVILAGAVAPARWDIDLGHTVADG